MPQQGSLLLWSVDLLLVLVLVVINFHSVPGAGEIWDLFCAEELKSQHNRRRSKRESVFSVVCAECGVFALKLQTPAVFVVPRRCTRLQCNDDGT